MCLTSVIAKVLESFVKEALLLHLSQHDILSDKQHGLIPHKSCCTQVLCALNDWTLHWIRDSLRMSFTLTSPRTLTLSLTTGYLISLKGMKWMGNYLNSLDPFLQTSTPTCSD